MKITELDIFNYCFAKSKLESEKQAEIEKSLELYKPFIDLVHASFKDISDVSAFVIAKLIEKKLEFLNINKNNVNSDSASIEFTLAAATTELTSADGEAITFIDKELKFLIRLLKMKDKQELFVYPEDIISKKFKLRLVPSGREFIVDDNSLKFECPIDEKVEKIIINEL